MRVTTRAAVAGRWLPSVAVLSALLVAGLSPALLARESGQVIVAPTDADPPDPPQVVAVPAEAASQAPTRMLMARVSPDWDWEPAVQPINRPAFLAPEPVAMAVPGYPPGRVRDGYQGIVVAEGTITPQGRVRDARIVRTPTEGIFDQAVLEALAQWRFRAAIRDGVPVDVTGIFTFKFEID